MRKSHAGGLTGFKFILLNDLDSLFGWIYLCCLVKRYDFYHRQFFRELGLWITAHVILNAKDVLEKFGKETLMAQSKMLLIIIVGSKNITSEDRFGRNYKEFI